MAPASPFSPRSPLPQEQLRRYLAGELDAAAQHQVELHLEQDPLLREAVEGMRLPGSLAAMEQLHNTPPPAKSMSSGMKIGVVAAAAVIVGAVWWYASRPEDGVAQQASNASTEVAPAVSMEQRAAFAEEVSRAKALPKEMRTGAASEEPFVAAVHAKRAKKLVRTKEEVVPIETRTTPIERTGTDDGPRTLDRSPSHRRLLFLHDLKLVDPSELYPANPLLSVRTGSVEARFSDAEARANAPSEERTIGYADFMNEALGRFVAGDRQACLEQLFYLMDQHPDDVNALFYGGLCAYELGLHQRAMAYLERANTHRIDTFKEESEWYHAMAVEKAQGIDAARPLVMKVAQRGGFYAIRADEWLSAR